MLAYEENSLPKQFLRGLSVVRLSGRAQIIVDPLINASGGNKRLSGGLTFYLDGAHSPESMDACARWFSAAAVERKDLSLSSVTSEVEMMDRAWTNGSIKHCHNQESEEILKRVFTYQKLFLCQAVQHIPRLLLLPLLYPHTLLERICHGSLTFREYGRESFMAKVFLIRIAS